MLEQEKLIAGVKANAVADERIAAVLMYGSFTQGVGDQYSDVEFYVFVKDTFLAALDTKAWIGTVHSWDVHLYNQYGTEVVIFDNLIRGEFHFLPYGELAIIESFAPIGYVPDIEAMCLYDPANEMWPYLQNLQINAAKINRADRESIENALNNALNLLLMGANLVKRGEYARAWEWLPQVQTCYLQLLRLHEEVSHNWLNPMKGLEREISAEAYCKFTHNTAGVDENALKKAYIASASNLKTLVKELSLKYNFDNKLKVINKIIKYQIKL